MESYKTSFAVAETPRQAFDAILNVRGWWSQALVGQSAKVGDEFEYRHKDMHYSRHRLTEVVPDKKVVWLTTDSSINFADDKTEWTGTTVIFEIGQQDGQTAVTFTHQGLTPQLSCYNDCTGGWNYYIKSLKSLITTGKGQPDN